MISKTFFIFIFEIVLIYFFSRLTIKNLFIFFQRIFNHKKTTYFFISLFFFPGTVIHEFGHLISAIVLNLRILEVKIFPEFKENQIRLGRVVYEKKDFIRSILVGIAPIFFAMLFFWLLAQWQIFPNKKFFLNLIFGYIIFAVSSTMFSSKQDLVDFVLIVPLVLFIIGIIYIFNVRLEMILDNILLVKIIDNFFSRVNFFLIFSLVVHLIINILFYSSYLFLRK